MNMPVKQLRLSQVTGLTISIAAPTATMVLNTLLTGQFGREHFSIEITLTEAQAAPQSLKPRDGGSESARSEHDPEADVYGENGERMPYLPARPRQFCLRSLPATRVAATAHWVRFTERMLMKLNEYEARFRRSAPSWHQILTVNQRPSRSRRRRLRWLLVGILISAVTLTTEMAPHRRAHSHAGQWSAPQPEADVLAGEFRRMLDFVRNGWTKSPPSQIAHLKEPHAGADH